MKRLLLVVPVVLLGVPLAVYLLLVSGARRVDDDHQDVLAHDVRDKGQTLPDAATMEKLAEKDPVAFLRYCILRYDRQVKGYTATLQKQERLKGKLYPTEIIEVSFREKPFSVFMHWLKNPRKAETVLYVKGENNDMMLVHPSGLAGSLVKVVDRAIDSVDARASGRYTLDKFGIKNGTLRTLAGWEAAEKRGKLKIEYLGKHRIKEVGDRICYKLHRVYDKPENDGVAELTLYIDKATWLQVGSVVKDTDGKLIGEYYFRDLHLNPEFNKDQFDRSAVAP
ncbi:MAG TPA: DUF1571 domain-containing protein [Gemmataceae bacterium]|jgi:hypothetical protein|nr:DUF1571 domain-containing protein [Gemmataceae bacterium]